MAGISNKLKGGDLRTIGRANSVVSEVTNQEEFDELFKGLFDSDRLVIMRSADAIEKITITHPEYLKLHKAKLLGLLNTAKHIELKWHLAQLIPRLKLNKTDTGKVWEIFTQWTKDKSGSRIVRIFSMQALFDIQKVNPELNKDFMDTISIMDRENIPSIKARVTILRKKL